MKHFSGAPAPSPHPTTLPSPGGDDASVRQTTLRGKKKKEPVRLIRAPVRASIRKSQLFISRFFFFFPRSLNPTSNPSRTQRWSSIRTGGATLTPRLSHLGGVGDGEGGGFGCERSQKICAIGVKTAINSLARLREGIVFGVCACVRVCAFARLCCQQTASAS